MPVVPPTERTLVARLAAHESWAQTEDRAARTAPARAALEARFLEMAGGDALRAASLRKAHYARLALRAHQARRRNREAREAQAAESAKARAARIAADTSRG